MFKSKSKSQKMREQAAEVLDKITPHVESARDKAAPMLADARDKAGPVFAEARDKAAPVFAEARDRATPAIDSARSKFTTEVLPVVTAAVAAATEATEDVRHEAKKRGLATAAALKGEVAAPKETHKLRNFLAFIGLAGLVAMVAKKLSDREASTAWQSSYTPTSAAPAGVTPVPTPSAPQSGTNLDDTPMGTAAAAAATTDDEGGAGPDEAAADATDVPHSVTTPDAPAEEIDVEGEKN